MISTGESLPRREVPGSPRESSLGVGATSPRVRPRVESREGGKGRLVVAPNPCVSCPYRRDVPSGVWAADEYEKLRDYDDEMRPPLAVFHCHQENRTGTPTVCRGWLSVHADRVAVRLAIAQGSVSADDVYAVPNVALWESGAAAAEHGLRDIGLPSTAAILMMSKLERRGVTRPA